jgi:hypothetical protein
MDFKNYLTRVFLIQKTKNNSFFKSISSFSSFKELLFAKTIYVLNVTAL